MFAAVRQFPHVRRLRFRHGLQDANNAPHWLHCPKRVDADRDLVGGQGPNCVAAVYNDSESYCRLYGCPPLIHTHRALKLRLQRRSVYNYLTVAHLTVYSHEYLHSLAYYILYPSFYLSTLISSYF
jgi:hypothetical protein